jgi:hypothetical protein
MWVCIYGLYVCMRVCTFLVTDKCHIHHFFILFLGLMWGCIQNCMHFISKSPQKPSCSIHCIHNTEIVCVYIGQTSHLFLGRLYASLYARIRLKLLLLFKSANIIFVQDLYSLARIKSIMTF